MPPRALLILPLLLSCSPFPERPVSQRVEDVGPADAEPADAGPRDVRDADAQEGADAQDALTDACRPLCGDAQCGDDGCGGVCGSCGPGTGCGDGVCEVRPWTAVTAEVVGFGEDVTGGADGDLCMVTNLDDDGAGSLRSCLLEAPVWVHFGVSGRVALSGPLQVPSDTTIDGRGQRVTLADQPVAIADAHNVILHNLTIDGTTFPAENGVFVYGASRGVWLHRLTVTRYGGVGVYLADAATDVTVSWCFFTDLPSGVIVGQPGQSAGVRATLHHNLFRSVDRYMPLVRAAQVHAFNNVMSGWTDVGGAVFFAGELFSEANVFEREGSGLAIETHPGELGYLRSVDDRVSEGLRIEESWPQLVFEPEYGYAAEENGPDFVGLINREAGFRQAPFPSQ